MKTNNIYFHCRGNKIDSDLVRAIRTLPASGMLILPFDAEMGCMKKGGKVIIYPHKLEEQLVTMEHAATEEYREHLAFSEFRIKGFYYEVLRENPFQVYKKIVKRGLYQHIFGEEPVKEITLEDCIWVAHSK